MNPREWRRSERRPASVSCAYRSCLRSLDVTAEWLWLWELEWEREPSTETVEPTDCERVEAEESVAAVLGCEDDVTHGDRGDPPLDANTARPPFLTCCSGLLPYRIAMFSVRELM